MNSPFNKIVVLLVVAFANTVLLTGCGGGGGNSATQTPAASNSVAQTPATTSDTVTTGADAVQPHMIGNDQRMAVVYECWYALRQSFLNTPNSTGPTGPPWSIWTGYTASNWDYLDNDPNALNFVRSLPTPGPFCSTSNFHYSPTQMQYGHGGQCTFFVTLIIKRARNKTLMGRGWSYPSGCPLVKNPQYPNTNGAAPVPGDIVFYYIDSNHCHVAIVVNTPPNGIEVVDSNDDGYGQPPWQLNSGFDGASSEIISRHTILWSQIYSKQYKVYSGSGQWYNTTW